MASQQYSLRWNNYVRHMTSAFESLRSDRDLIDVTLSCEGKKIPAHKMLLSACSSYFKDLFKENPCQHPVIIFRNVTFDDLMALVDFMYNGEVNVEQEQLASFLNTAELLQVQGLTNSSKDQEKVKKTAKEDERVPASGSHFEEDVEERTSTPTRSGPPAAKKRKWQSPNRTESPAAVLESQTAQGSADGDEDVQSIEQVPLKTETPDYDEDEDIQAGSGVDDTADEQDIVQKLQKSDQLVLTSNRNRTSNNEHSLFGNNSVDMDSGDMSSFGMAGPSNESMGQEGMQEPERMIIAPLADMSSFEDPLGNLEMCVKQEEPLANANSMEKVLVVQLEKSREIDKLARKALKDPDPLLFTLPDGTFQCLKCDATHTSKDTARRHVSRNHQFSQTCMVCFKQFKRKKTLRNHLLEHAGLVRCKLCNKNFKSIAQLKLHFAKHRKRTKK
ncbi:sex determination protein fruitless-like isoform X5 [Neocloeon triangulifer]|uniref:sex determination protein fruitless-like isoform X5 n=1 Tax=Neocloeon triangulifer TaxID=2078957 RepID=UPI00286F9E57|nr:sex determination protein fruitless-like isoform X5 [Neocloeon triangulifer]